jgi:hypothetical protein
VTEERCIPNRAIDKLSLVTVSLSNVHEFQFNDARKNLKMTLQCPILDMHNYTVFINGKPELKTTHTEDSITVNRVSADSVVLSLFALDTYGLPIFTSFQLYFGLITVHVRVSFANGIVAAGVTVNVNLTDNTRVGQTGVTDDRGMVIFNNVPSSTISLVAHTRDNQISLAGVVPSSSQIDLILIPLNNEKQNKELEKQRYATLTTLGKTLPTIASEAYGSNACTNCETDCVKCPSDPMCHSACMNPVMQTCSFYSDCMESKVPCGPNGYALSYGLKFCHKFSSTLESFSPRGQRWIWDTMNCLQKTLVPSLENCKNNCSILQKAAFASHPRCYVKSGVCELPAFDWVTIVSVVGKDLLNEEGFVQALKTVPHCVPDILERISVALMQESLPLPLRISLMILETWLRSL